jgi:hypothetical protein
MAVAHADWLAILKRTTYNFHHPSASKPKKIENSLLDNLATSPQKIPKAKFKRQIPRTIYPAFSN